MVVVDSTILLLLFRPDAGVPTDANGRPVTDPKERVEFLISELDKAKTRIILPTPALSEVLVRAGTVASQAIVEEINRQAVFRIEPFDTRAAIEVAAMTRADLGGKKKRRRDETWAKMKFDRQIVAIAKVCQATTIYSDDRSMRAVAQHAGIAVVGLADLPLPPETAQRELPLETQNRHLRLEAGDGNP
jgi:predicted nucleic acid-binding protein